MLTEEERVSLALARNDKEAAEKRFFDAAQPFYHYGFSVGCRDTHHWDVYADRPAFKENAHNAVQPERCHLQVPADNRVRERVFAIRGEPGNVIVRDEHSDPHRPHPRESLKFDTLDAAMGWISRQLMKVPE